MTLRFRWGHINVRGFCIIVWRHWTSRKYVTVLVFPKLTWCVVVQSRCQSVLYRGGNWSRVAVNIGRFHVLWWYKVVRCSHSSGRWRVFHVEVYHRAGHSMSLIHVKVYQWSGGLSMSWSQYVLNPCWGLSQSWSQYVLNPCWGLSISWSQYVLNPC